jgi:hypothetical protein
LGRSFQKLNVNAIKAAQGSDAAQKAFRTLGVQVKNADGTLRGTEELLLDVADKFATMKDGAQKAALAQEVFGKGAQRLIPFLNQGREGIQKLRDEADKLGFTLSGNTAAAAEQFNDNLTKLSFAGRGLVNRLIEEILPAMTAITEKFVSTSQESGTLEASIKVLAVTLKTLYSVGATVVFAFDRIGESIGAASAAAVAAASGNFSEAAAILREAEESEAKDYAELAATFAATWSDQAPAFAEAGRELGGALTDGVEEAIEDTDVEKATKAALDKLTDMEAKLREQVATFGMGEKAVLAYSIAHGELAEAIALTGERGKELAASIVEQTDAMLLLQDQQTAEEEIEKINNAVREEGIAITESVVTAAEKYAATLERLNALLDAGAISQTTHDRAAAKAKEDLEKADKEVNKFLERANENIQDIIGEGLETALHDGVKEGARGALQSFADMLVKMSAQAVAANLASKIFGEGGLGGDTSGTGGAGWLGKIFSFFGGTRDAGGRGQPGGAYMIGTGAQPEMFVPDTHGTFVPAGAGGMQVNNYFTVHANGGQVSRRTEQQIAASAARGLQSANMRGN